MTCTNENEYEYEQAQHEILDPDAAKGQAGWDRDGDSFHFKDLANQAGVLVPLILPAGLVDVNQH